ncbi:hypothetical protein K470DRAFT_116840 [Piedraia hortae CBS 480.64]|uniref:Secreted protein n=1 Tax=Piedraia hortae CBS 480.64 TaxID=1314780 RepID=A0A6A7BU10_9PEZI|nr:hypothetical protein K470DRAFT_116840 [Piedraia hortae CBS 480.64]
MFVLNVLLSMIQGSTTAETSSFPSIPKPLSPNCFHARYTASEEKPFDRDQCTARFRSSCSLSAGSSMRTLMSASKVCSICPCRPRGRCPLMRSPALGVRLRTAWLFCDDGACSSIGGIRVARTSATSSGPTGTSAESFSACSSAETLDSLESSSGPGVVPDWMQGAATCGRLPSTRASIRLNLQILFNFAVMASSGGGCPFPRTPDPVWFF